MATSVTFSTINLPLISQEYGTILKIYEFAKYAYFQMVIYWIESAL